MNQFKDNELPLGELEKLGLYIQGRILLSRDNINALLTGRRTEMTNFKDLKFDGLSIPELDAKLSLKKNQDGSVSLNVHPIYKVAKAHDLLDENESQKLQNGEIDNIAKEQEVQKGKVRKIIIEYDEQTKEFISYDPEKVNAPLTVNSETLTEEQKKKFKNGQIVELSDGTRFQHTALNPQGLKSDNKRLALSILFDAGISYLVYRGIQALKNRAAKFQSEGYTNGYNQAIADMKQKGNVVDSNVTIQQLINKHIPNQESRGYGRSSSR